MGKINFYRLPKAEKEAIFQAIATEMGMPPFAVEKDWWVSRTLEIIFKMDISKHLVFKGGTSLSKAWKLIHRFSEDIDLALDRAFFITPQNNWSRSEITKLRKGAGAYSTSVFLEELKTAFYEKGFNSLEFKVIEAEDSDQDPRIIEIYYPNIIAPPSAYVLPRVQLEIGVRSLREPYTMSTFGALVDEVYAGREFAEPLFEVPTVNPERTFLEKLFLLHEEFHRPTERMRVDRLSRHLYDIYHLNKVGVAETAMHNQDLYETIVAHRYKFSKVGGVDYNSHHPKTLNPIPMPEIIDAWRSDYSRMMEEMIYENNAPTFEQLIETLNGLKTQIQQVGWAFNLSFPQP